MVNYNNGKIYKIQADNGKDNRCMDCRKNRKFKPHPEGFCIDCDKKIDPKYKRCWKCNDDYYKK